MWLMQQLHILYGLLCSPFAPIAHQVRNKSKLMHEIKILTLTLFFNWLNDGKIIPKHFGLHSFPWNVDAIGCLWSEQLAPSICFSYHLQTPSISETVVLTYIHFGCFMIGWYPITITQRVQMITHSIANHSFVNLII